MRCPLIPTLLALLVFSSGRAPAGAADDQLDATARSAMRKAATYYRENVARHGGYVYYSSPDLKQRWGEGAATPDQILVQPPGTPTVGLAYLAAYKATGDKFYLDAARDAGEALVYGQLESGGWTASRRFRSPRRKGRDSIATARAAGRTTRRSTTASRSRPSAFWPGSTRPWNSRTRRSTSRSHSPSMRCSRPSSPTARSRRSGPGRSPSSRSPKASFPDYDWRTEGRVKEYWTQYTLNDGLAGTVSETLLDAAEVYKDAKYKAALAKLGDFLLLAQMPEPQPAWGQQYSYDMQPIWARRFEPPRSPAANRRTCSKRC